MELTLGLATYSFSFDMKGDSLQAESPVRHCAVRTGWHGPIYCRSAGQRPSNRRSGNRSYRTVVCTKFRSVEIFGPNFKLSVTQSKTVDKLMTVDRVTRESESLP
jgi:hypothetical protein